MHRARLKGPRRAPPPRGTRQATESQENRREREPDDQSGPGMDHLRLPPFPNLAGSAVELTALFAPCCASAVPAQMGLWSPFFGLFLVKITKRLALLQRTRAFRAPHGAKVRAPPDRERNAGPSQCASALERCARAFRAASRSAKRQSRHRMPACRWSVAKSPALAHHPSLDTSRKNGWALPGGS